MTKKRLSYTIYLDGAAVRLHNRRISFIEKDGNTILKFWNACSDAKLPACLHEALKGKVRRTSLKMTNESMELLVSAWLIFKSKRK